MDVETRSLPLYPLSTLAALCGVDAATLRNWELRYGLLQPHRDHDDRRYYSDADLDRIRCIIRLLDAGVPIDQVGAQLSERDTAARSPEGNAWDELRRELRHAIAAFDDYALETIYHEAMATYPVRCVLRHALLPLLEEYGDRWRDQNGAIAEEHFFAFFLRNKLGARFHHRRVQNYGPKLLAACLPGDHHDLGLLLFALYANERGYRSRVLGADTPLSETAIAARRSRAHAVVLSTSLPPTPAVLKEHLPDFVRALPMPVFIGGAMTDELSARFESLGMVVVNSKEPDRAVDEMCAHLARCA